MSKTRIWTVLLAAAGLVAWGDGEPVTANWLPTAAGTYTLTDGANWDTGVAPTNGIDIANFAPGAIEGAQNIDLPAISSISSWNLGTVTGASNQTIRTPGRHSNGTAIRYLTVANPNGFRGTWALKDAHARLYLIPTNSLVPSLATLDCFYAPMVTTYPGTSVVERLTGGGLVHKAANNNDVQSNNVLQIKGVAPFTQAKTRIRMANHTVVSLDYEGVATNLPVTAGIYVRFDASRPDTIDTETVDGKRFVTAWRDADGRSVTATPYTGNDTTGARHGQRPWLSEVTSVNGFPLVDFGAFEQTNADTVDVYYDTLKETLGPAASLEFAQTAQAREVFVAWQDTQASNSQSFVIGSRNDYDLHRDTAGYLLANYHAELHVNDETYVDGALRNYRFGPYDYTRLTVASVSLSGNAKVGTLAQDRNIRFGGARIAEVIVYTQELSSLERQAVHAYLQRKWTSNAKFDPIMLRDIQVDASNQIFEVPEGRTVDVGLLKVLSSQTFVKTGDGTLNVDTLANDGVLKLDVRGGAVTFNRMLTGVDDAAPAADPMFWLDATAADSFVRTNLEHGVAGRDYIHRWNDCRPTQTKYYAYPMNQAIDTNRPFVVANAANGHAVVDFGTGIITNKNAPWNGYSPDAARLRFNANVDAYDGFVVLRMNNPDSHYVCANGERGLPPLFGVDTQGFTRWGTDKLLAQYADADPLTAYWCIDGVSYVPVYDTFTFGTNDFHVVSFSQLKTIRVNRLADDRNIVFGGQQIGEVLFYDRPLSEHERRQTEAYLMKKWKNMTSPAMREKVNLNTITFAEGVTPILSSDRLLSVATLNAAADATITQKGSGTVTLPTEPLGATRGYVADGGTLVVKMSDPFADAFYHFDATDAESVVDDGAGGVTQWLDTRRNGMSAVSVVKGMSVAKPTLNTVETRNGKTMPVIDFGDVSYSGGQTSTDTAGMDIRQNGADLGEAAGRVKEIHVVYCDKGSNYDGYKQRFIFSDHGRYPFHRGDGNGQMFGRYSDNPYTGYTTAPGAYVALDGTSVAYNYNLTDKQFHVISAAPTNGVPVRSIARDRSARAGGSYQGELIAFKEHLSPERRAYLQRYLMWKWLGEGTEPVYTNSASELRVANGGTLSFAGAPTVSVPAISGTGTIAAGNVVDVSSLAFDFPDARTYGQLTVNGTLTLAAAGTVSVTVGAGATEPGDYPLLTATSLVGGLANWTQSIDNDSNLAPMLVTEGNTLYLRLTPKGTVLIFR